MYTNNNHNRFICHLINDAFKKNRNNHPNGNSDDIDGFDLFQISIEVIGTNEFLHASTFDKFGDNDDQPLDNLSNYQL